VLAAVKVSEVEQMWKRGEAPMAIWRRREKERRRRAEEEVEGEDMVMNKQIARRDG